MLRRLFNSVVETTLQSNTDSVVYTNPFTKRDTFALGWLTNVAPCFGVKATSVSILTEPQKFYETLLSLCKDATQRITLVSLYLGNGELERKLVNVLMNNEHFQNKSLTVNVLLDYTRGSRATDNSRTMLQPLLQKNENNCNVSLYHTPVLRGILKKFMPNRYNELLGLQHMKLYIFDDTLVISGANLSNDYFSNRQDRYFVIKDRSLTDFYSGLVNRVQTFCLKMDKNNNVMLCNEWDCSPYEGSKMEFIEKAGNLIEEYLEQSKLEQNTHKQEGCDTWIFPVVQMGQLGINQDALVTERILAEAPAGSKLQIATGYFNLTKNYMNTLIEDTQANCNILMAHPKANGFLGAKGLAGGIPYAYSLIAKRFQERYESQGQKMRIHIYEYIKDGWTYHGKGLWYYPSGSKYPCMTMVGSPNFGERSVNRDLETQMVVVTENSKFQKQLHDECENLFKLGIPAETHRKVPFWVNLFVLFCRSYF